jgi:hypothetical protein
MDRALEQTFAWMEELFDELRLPGVSKSSFMNRPSLKHRRKSIIGSKDGEALVVHCPLEIKELLIEAEPEIYFQTDHYKAYPALLMRPEKVDKKILSTRIEAAWRMNATKSQLAAYKAIEAPDTR